MSDTLVINEIYLSIQGESSRAGWPCVFIRLTACNLRCSYCDTAYAFAEGQKMKISAIVSRVRALAMPFATVRGQKLPLVELTGGEPLLQPNALPLMTQLCDADFTVLLETSGAHDIRKVDSRVHRIMDLKCPSSGESDRNYLLNLQALTDRDEIKFVIGTEEDYQWSKEMIERHRLDVICPLLVSWVSPLTASQQHPSLKKIPKSQRPISRQALVEQLLADALPVRFQLQMHKFIWPADAKGV